MQTITSIQDCKTIRSQLDRHLRVGFVPTMGNLHRGHQTLIQQARAENDIVFLSIYVNQTQFNNPQDFANYPQTRTQDLTIAEQECCDFVFLPTFADMYPDNYTLQIQETQLATLLEGQYRPGHFTGVLTIVMKLLQLIKPQRVYFGEKDWQQLKLVESLVQAFFLDTTVVACPTVREASGLPLSSRNNLLNNEQKQQAALFPKYFHSPLPCNAIAEKLTSLGFGVEYIEEYNNRRFAAVKLGQVRLIDNFVLEE